MTEALAPPNNQEALAQLTNPEALFAEAEPQAVDDFKSNYLGAIEYAHDYPGDRPETSFLADTEGFLAEGILEEHEGEGEARVYPMLAELNENGKLDVKVKLGNDEEALLDDILEALGQPGMGDRIPIVGYGANVCPRAMSRKFHVEGLPEVGLVPNLYASLKGYEATWYQNPGSDGNGIAALDEIEGADLQVAVNFLTPAQVLALHRSEQGYDIGHLKMGTVTLEGGVEIPALIYAADEPVVQFNGEPVAVTGGGIRRNAEVLPSMTSEEVVGNMMHAGDTQNRLTTIDERFGAADLDSFGYAEIVRTLDAETKLKVRGIIREENDIAEVSLVDSINAQSWSLPDTLPTLNELIEGTHSQSYNAETNEQFVQMPSQALAGASKEVLADANEKVAEHYRDIIKPKLEQEWASWNKAKEAEEEAQKR